LAHLICYLEFGSQIRSHGIEFRQICQRYHWGEEVYKAAASLEIENQKVSNSLDEEKVMDKIKKLLSLAQSQNPHEKEMATLRANDLITKYNLEHTRKFSFSNSNEVEEEVCTECVLFFSRISQKYLTISSILRHFFVYPVFSKNDRGGYLEVCGDKTNVEIASYVASFLDNSLEDLWQKTKREKNLSGIPMKNSFFRGLAQGYDEKILKQQEMFKTYNSNLGKDLIILEKKLKQKVNIAYSHLGSVQSRGQHSVSAHEIGKQKGKNLQIHAGLKNGVMTPLLN